MSIIPKPFSFYSQTFSSSIRYFRKTYALNQNAQFYYIALSKYDAEFGALFTV